jgi:hypothetical protein
MDGSFLYIVHTRECRNLNLNIYKIGRTKKCLHRIISYGKQSIFKLVVQVDDYETAGNKVITEFKTLFIHKKFYGTHYFEGNLHKMQVIMMNIVNFVNLHNKFDESYNLYKDNSILVQTDNKLGDNHKLVQNDNKLGDNHKLVQNDNNLEDVQNDNNLEEVQNDNKLGDVQNDNNLEEVQNYNKLGDVQNDNKLGDNHKLVQNDNKLEDVHKLVQIDNKIKNFNTHYADFCDITTHILDFFKENKYVRMPDKSIRVGNVVVFANSTEFIKVFKKNAQSFIEIPMRNVSLLQECDKFVENDDIIPQAQLPLGQLPLDVFPEKNLTGFDSDFRNLNKNITFYDSFDDIPTMLRSSPFKSYLYSNDNREKGLDPRIVN